MNSALDVSKIKEQYPAFGREVGGRPAVFLDGPAGSQVPQSVIDAVAFNLAHQNANQGGAFASSQECGLTMANAGRAVADLLGTDDPELVSFGANMTTLTFALSRALAATWKAGDRILLTDAEHDANFTPWIRAAGDRGVEVDRVRIREDDASLDLEDLKAKLERGPKLVAVACASNSLGNVHPVQEITKLAHDAGALVFLDAVHYAPHRLMDVSTWGCDFLVCSAYKFFGPHVGILWGRRELMESLPAYKVRPAYDATPDRWMTGTQNQEGIAGTLAAIDYLAGLSGDGAASRRAALQSSFELISQHESKLLARLLSGLAEREATKAWGITDLERLDERVATVSFSHARHKPHAIAEHLGERGIFVWSGNFYALPLSEAMGLEPDGLVRVGFLHYNTEYDVDRLLEALDEL
ncbi:MAG: cysteine desulfurase-like protein, partial [Planctomycetota bacterium]